MKKIILLAFLSIIYGKSFAQNSKGDSLKHQLAIAKQDTSRILLISDLISYYIYNKPDSAFKYGASGLKLLQKTNYPKGEANLLNRLGFLYRETGNLPKALDFAIKSLIISEQNHDLSEKGRALNLLGVIYFDLGDFIKAIGYYQQMIEIAKGSNNQLLIDAGALNVASCYLELGKLNSADSCIRIAYHDLVNLQSGSAIYLWRDMGRLEAKSLNYPLALIHLKKSGQIALRDHDHRNVAYVDVLQANVFEKTNQTDSVIFYSKLGLQEAKFGPYNKFILMSAELLVRAYKTKNDFKNALLYRELAAKTKEGLFGAGNIQAINEIIAQDNARKKEIDAQKIAYQNQARLYVLILGLFILLVAALLQWRNSRQRKKAYLLLQQQKDEIEAQKALAVIEAALERVRGKTMAMHHSEELAETAAVLFQQLSELGNQPARISIGIPDEENAIVKFWATDQEGDQINISFSARLNERTMSKMYAGWKEKIKSLSIDMQGVELNEWVRFCREEMGIIIRDDLLKEQRIHTVGYFSQGWINYTTHHPLSAETITVLERFAAVFEQTYTRFLDLQKAEAQAREGQIEVALERVRSKTMAMHSSQDVADTVALMFDELVKLGIEKNIRCGIGILDDTEHIELWTAFNNPEGQVSLIIGSLDMTTHPLLRNLYNAWKNKEDHASYEMAGDDLIAYYRVINDAPDYPTQFDMASLPAKQFHYDFFFPEGTIFAFSPNPLTPEAIQIFKRFTGVFGLTYRRYLDLLKAEAQVRESQIQLGLERVRARAMAMQSSGELAEMVDMVFKELTKLDFGLTHCAIAIADADSVGLTLWQANSEADQPPVSFYRKSFDHPYPNAAYKEWKKGTPKWVYHLKGAEKKAMHDYYASSQETMYVSNAVKEGMAAFDSIILSHSFNNFGYLRTDTTDPLSEDNLDIVYRFAKAFDLCYTRFTDIKQAEAQAKESQIQLALERVRARTMAMQKSEELREVIQVVYDQLVQLGTQVDQAGFGMDYRESNDWNLWIADQGHEHPDLVHIPYFDTPQFNLFIEARDKGLDHFSDEMTFEEKNKFFEECFKHGRVSDEAKEFIYSRPGWFTTTVLLENVTLFITNLDGIPYSEAEIAAFMRFGKVFEQTYRRYLDLKKAEAQAREANIEAALERVRGRTMAMHHSSELPEISFLLFQQLKELGEMAIQNSIGIVNENEGVVELSTTVHGSHLLKTLNVPIDDPYLMAKAVTAWKANRKSLTLEFEGEELKNYNELRNSFMETETNFPEDRWVVNISFFSKGWLSFSFNKNVSGEIILAQERFANVFEQTYTRFNDLQQAEAQAHEAKIEVGLERVRAKAMSMQTSEELNELIGTVFGELTKLDVVLTRCLIMIFDPEIKSSRWWMANSEAPAEPMNYLVQYHEHDAYTSYINAWEERVLKWQYELKGKVKKTWDDFLFTETELSLLPDPVITGMKAPEQVILSASFNNFGCLTLVSLEPLSDEHFDLLLRFAKVFDMSYTRFNDLKQAEAQAREARIEAALERVRSKTMAMYSSEDIDDVAITMFDELVKLGVETTIRCGVAIIHNIKKMELWTAASSHDGSAALSKGYIDMTLHPLLRGAYDAWKKQETVFSYVLAGNDVADYYRILSEYADYPFQLNIDTLPERRFHNSFVFPEGTLYAFTDEPLSAEAMQLFKRFAGVFGLTYRRFLDLQKAEAQAREARIETALEKVRGKAMAMHNSRDVGDATALVFSELYKLGISTIRCGVVIIEESTKLMEVWSATSPGEGKVDQGSGKLDMTTHPLWQNLFNIWKQKKTTFTYELAGPDLLSYYKAISGAPGYNAPEIDPGYAVLGDPSNTRQYCSCFLFAEGGLFTFTKEPFPPQESKILEKFAAVFALTYRRYLDLKQAEEQARDAQIEAALEKVRGKAMAMYNSKDLSSTASMVFTELRKLGIDPLRCGVGIAGKGSRKVLLYSATTSAEGDNLALMGWVMLAGHPVLEKIQQSIATNEDYFPVLKGKQLKLYYEKLLSGLSLPSVPDWETGNEQFGHFFPFQDGCLYAWSEKPYGEPDMKILKRFASVIDLTFRRYIELQKSEASARGAIRQASLDRMRAQIASMRSTNDLQSITPLVWNELTALGIPFIRCGVFIVDEQQEVIHSYLSTPDGKAIAAFPLGFNADGIAKTVLASWQKKQFAAVHWNEEEFKKLSVQLVQQGAIASEEKYLTAHPPTSLDLHFFPFLQGMLYVGNITQLGDDEKNLVQSLADAFSTAYARYEDFNKLEAAKQEVEQTLTGLKAAQTQLIQSEKMASLGELTAGIAHEIQNPLNFVNNFSEVNQEMIDELKEELKGGNLEEAIAIADSIRQNEEKINHHGKRADFIVKGMLQHSRTSTGEKQLTNINVLADEFIKLSYHGLRAKDKSFNAEMISHFDPGLPKVNVVQQDIGRVLLNLFNNAFYAVSQKQKISGAIYKPEVTVNTSSENGSVVIKVKDNGIGIPDAIKDKIMQPFFTTKPTGEGTGLGLSLSYDMVVKGHSGQIRVNSEEGEFTEFIVALPVGT
ncbi:MAG: hypothetical protein JWR02_1006 [Mucilaginibacter sp.]|nr:hypothetical protein [Mucilaginibacter sp.]